jgi:hypothetical protein
VSVENQGHSRGSRRDGAARLKEDPISQIGLLIPGNRYPALSWRDFEIAWSVTGRVGLPVAARDCDHRHKGDDAEHQMTHLEISFTVERLLQNSS